MSKKLFIIPAILLAAFGVTFLSSCGKDCKFDSSDFVGQYAISEDCSNSAPASYNITVTTGASETDIKIANFWNTFGAAVNATIDCENVSISRQDPDNDGYFIEGSGSIDKSDGITTLTLTYTVTDETDPSNILTDVCSSSIFVKL
ncbi:MAG: hypothetical protein Q7T20_03765 [Saprospiraceae bacterium]|nr:hypothetical protein [Saprospiraceae bacterium]